MDKAVEPQIFPKWYATPIGVIGVIAVNLCVTFGVHVLFLQGPIGGISPWGFISWGALTLMFLAVFTLGAVLVGQSDRTAAANVYGIAQVTGLMALSSAVYFIMPDWQGWALFYAFAAAYCIGAVVTARIALQGGLIEGRKLWLHAAPTGALMLGAMVLWANYFSYEPMVYPIEPETEAADFGPDIDTEDLYARQPALLQAQIGALKPEVSSEVELFALLGAGDATQSVFLSEVNAVAQILEAGFDAKGKILRLANSEQHPFDYPMAGRRNLAQALNALGAHIGPEDLALIYLTSHGAPDVFDLNFYDAGLLDLTAVEFAQMLDASGIQQAVVVLQACYSGSFIDDIASDSRLIITAASEDRTSFGCADGRDWTEFGKAYFDVALRKSRDFRVAFAQAEPLIAAREKELELLASQPRIQEGSKIGAALDVLNKRLSANLAQP